jgi:hypothetical protein
MKLSGISKLSFDPLSSASRPSFSPLSPIVSLPCVSCLFSHCGGCTPRSFKTEETQAGQEIQSILHKGGAAFVPRAAPLPVRSPLSADYSDEEEEEDEEPYPCRPFAAPRRWLAASPTRLADGTGSELWPMVSHHSDCHPIPRPAAESPDTIIVGTPPCRAGNPMINDTRFMAKGADRLAEFRRASGVGCELGLFRLSPPAI